MRELDLASWRRRVAAIFQDFVHYELPVARQHRASAPSSASATSARDPVARAQRAGALELIEALPHGLATPLSRAYTGGVDVSGGQWQRIALARALFAVERRRRRARARRADREPRRARRGGALRPLPRDDAAASTTILISHRFSTVRRADRIVVLDARRDRRGGDARRAASRGGRYAELFRLQARDASRRRGRRRMRRWLRRFVRYLVGVSLQSTGGAT